MGEPKLTVICHFRNEEVYLPYWLRHHVRQFDHGVMIDYASTDRSRHIISQLAPRWEIRSSRNAQFHSVSVDAEVMDIEKEFNGWKICLNVTEFVLHHDLHAHVRAIEQHSSKVMGMVTTGFIIQDMPEQVRVPLDDRRDLWVQRHFGCAEPDPANGNCFLRRRLLHRDEHGRYLPGRHSNGVSNLTEPPLYLFWYGWCPLELKMRRNKSTAPMVPMNDLTLGWGIPHTLNDDEVIETWRTKYLPHCHDLFDGRHPLLNEAVERLCESSRSS